MKKRTSSKTLLKPTKYQHFHLSGRSRGPPQTTKITPGAPLDPPQTPSENFTCFRSLPGAPQGPPGASRGPPQGPPETPQGRPGTPRGTPNAPQGPPQRPPGTPRGRPGPPEGIPQSQRTAQGPTPRFGPAECAERLNPPPPAKSREPGVF